MPVFNVANSGLSTLTQAQQDNLLFMSNTDVRSVLSSLDSISAVQLTQAASLALNTVGVTELKAITVIEKTKTLEKASFTYAANLWTVNVFHELNNKFPITAIFDATGDAQFIQFIGKDLMNGTVELTQSQYDLNAFPLNIVLHSRSAAVAVPSSSGQWKLNTITNVYYRFLNGFIEASNDGINASANRTQSSVNSAYMNASDSVAIFMAGSDYYTVPLSSLGGTWTYLSLVQYQNYIALPGAVAL